MSNRAIVTGAASGIGRNCAERLLDEGRRVALLDRDQTVVEVAASLGDAATGIVCDVTDEAACESAVAAAESFLGGIGDLVHAAGIAGRQASLVDLTLADFRQVIDINLVGTFLMARPVARRMLAAQEGGSIVLIGSTGGRIASPQDSAYAAAKGGVHLLMQALALEVGSAGVRVNAIAPGPILTDMHYDYLKFLADQEGSTPDEELNKIRAQIPIGRHGEVEDVAATAAWLVSDEAGFITAQTIAVDGGVIPTS